MPSISDPSHPHNRKAFAIRLPPLKESSPPAEAHDRNDDVKLSSNTDQSRPPLGQITTVQNTVLEPHSAHALTSQQFKPTMPSGIKSAEKKSPLPRILRRSDLVKTSPRTGLLRYGERVEDLFGIPQSTPWDDSFYQKCRQLYTIEEGPSAKTNERERCQLWLDVLKGAQKHTQLDGSALVRLYRRATSRMPWQPESELAPLILEIWLSYVRIQMEHASLSDAQLTLRHLRAQEYAAYHLALAQVEEKRGKSESEVIQLLQMALTDGATPKEIIYQALQDRGVHWAESDASPLGKRIRESIDPESPEIISKRHKQLEHEVAELEKSDEIHSAAKNESLDNSNMSLDDDDDDDDEGAEKDTNREEDDSDTIKWKTNVKLLAKGKPELGANPQNFDEVGCAESPNKPPVQASSAEDVALQNQNQCHATPSVTITGRQPFSDASRQPCMQKSDSSQTPIRAAVPGKSTNSLSVVSRHRRPLVNKLPRLVKISGKAQRADPNQSKLLDEEDDSMDDCISQASSAMRSTTSSAKKAKSSLSKLDLSYIFEWDPNKRFEERKSSETAQIPPSMPTCTDSSASHHSTEPKNIKEREPVENSNETKDTTKTKRESPRPPKPTDILVQPAPVGESGTNKKPQVKFSSVPEKTRQPEKIRKLSKSTHMEINKDFMPLVSERNILRVNDASYVKLGVVGKGGSCKVYRALSKDCTVVAIKKVKTDGLNEKAIESYANEIKLLRSLTGNPAIIQMYDSQVDLQRKAIFVVMELGEVDLNHVLQQQSLLVNNGEGGKRLNMNFVRLTWFQMLSAVHGIHEARIIHGDLKPANFLFVRGALKLIDFGIAKAIQSDDTTNIYRENQIGTLNYMSPEAIMESGNDPDKPKLKLGRVSLLSVVIILSMCLTINAYTLLFSSTGFRHLVSRLHTLSNGVRQDTVCSPPDHSEAAGYH